MNLNCIGSFLNDQGLNINPDASQYMGYYSNGVYTSGALTGGKFLEITSRIFELAFDVRYPVKSMGQLTPGRKYYIRSLGTTGLRSDFTLLGAATNRVGIIFKAVSDGGEIAGTNGTCNEISGIEQDGMTLQQYTSLLTMGYFIPMLTNTPPYYYTMDFYSTTCKYGFLGEFAVQAYEEFYINNGSYSDFFNTLSTILGYKDTTNDVIDGLSLGLTHLDGIYSNMNDLITSDITGVSISTFFWGQDLIKLGRALDLQTIQTFGNPDNLLRTLAANKAITTGLNIVFAAAGLDSNDITDIINGKTADNNQQKLLYACYTLISGSDLAEILMPLNCHTQNLETLADLLNLRKIFPKSYETLTFPQYNSQPRETNSKTYYLLYNGTQVNKIPSLSYGTRLFGIIPSDIAYAADAFSMSMRQIKNIQNIDIEKFAQVVTNLENVNDLQVNGTNTPTNKQAIESALSKIAYGSNVNGKFRTVDFLASMTNLLYPWKEVDDALVKLSKLPEITELQALLQSLYNELNKPLGTITSQDFSDKVQPKIDLINILVTGMFYSHQDLVIPINDLYNRLGAGLAREQYIRKKAIPGGIEFTTSSTMDVYSFVDSLNTYSLETEPGQTAVVLENIANGVTLGGQSLVGSMREARNSQRMGLMGGELDNKVVTTPLSVPVANGARATLSTTTGNVEVSVTNGGPMEGSLGGSSQSTLIPSNLNILNMATGPSVLVPSAAIQHVSACNCDCWDLIV
jgi:hypothetical protein